MTNLQIFPKDTPREQVIATMQQFTQSLGVQCNYCHVQEGRGGRNDMASDEKPTKKAARGMMMLAREINTKLPEAIGKPADATTRVGCATCHRGVPIPKQLAEIVIDAGAAAAQPLASPSTRSSARSSTAARATTSAKASLVAIAQRANAAGKADDALAYLNANLEYFPKSARTYQTIAAAQEHEGRQGRRDRGARESRRARSEQRAGEGAAGESQEVATRSGGPWQVRQRSFQ